MSAENQIEKLANYIMSEFPEEIVDGGAGDVAILILSEYKKLTSDNSDSEKSIINKWSEDRKILLHKDSISDLCKRLRTYHKRCTT